MPNGDLIVTSKMVDKQGPVLIVKPDGLVLRGTAGIDMLDETTYVVSNVIEGRDPRERSGFGFSGMRAIDGAYLTG